MSDMNMKRPQTAGPLVVSRENPRYFAVGQGADAGRAVYLTGSHIWNNFHDGLGTGGECVSPPESNAYGDYLDFLAEHGHNFIRLWRWENFKSQAAGGSFHLCMTPQPWLRTGPGEATDGDARFDLDQHNEAYFKRLRGRVVAANERGIYVAVMLFDGWALHLSPPPDHVAGHPFYASNNINGISIESVRDYEMLPLSPRIRELQEAYIRKVIDTVADLPNVLYEVANEASGMTGDEIPFPDGSSWPGLIGDSTEWQYWVIDFVRGYERERGYAVHPIGMTMMYPVPDHDKINEPLYNSSADWISPGADDGRFGGGPADDPDNPGTRWYLDPPANDGRKVMLVDTDHYAPGQGDALWAWKSFLRGHQPILMDYGIINLAEPLDPSLGVPSYESLEAARYAMGDTLSYAQHVNLNRMLQHDELSSTGYALADPGAAYIVLQPEARSVSFDVSLQPGTYAVEWYNVSSREKRAGEDVDVTEATAHSFSPPFAGAPTLLLLQHR